MSRSTELFERAKKVTPGGVHSPVRAFGHVKRPPIFFARAQGCTLYDVDENAYIDFCASFGPHFLGHGNPVVIDALNSQIPKATSFGACHEGEVLLSEKIIECFPFLDKVRLVNSGTEAVMTALRIARGVSGKNKVIKFEGCYHGHTDSMLVKSGSGVAELSAASSNGVPAQSVADTLVARLDDLTEFEKLAQEHGNDLAAVILEPVPANHGLWVPTEAHLKTIEKITRDAGALLIFDEVISGFRLSLSGACGIYDVTPDIVTMGKIIGGGLPVAAVAGTARLMDGLAPTGEVYQAGTLSGNPLAAAAGVAVIDYLKAHSPYEMLEKRTQSFTQELEQILNTKYSVKLRQKGSIFWTQFSQEDSFPVPVTPEGALQYGELFQTLLDAGIYWAPSPYEVGFVSTVHTEAVLDECLEKIKKAIQ